MHPQSYVSTSGKPEKPRLAFLGPLGTYSHQAAFECFRGSVEYVAQPTIATVQQTLSTDVPFGIIPQENSTNGTVVETYNILRIPAVGQETFVRGAYVLGVRHALVTRRGVKLDDIETILSHEQALGQCGQWLSVHLPRASLVHTDSTAAAAKKLLSDQSELDLMKCAAICSTVVITIYEGLEILKENIQDGPENFTRFYILSHGRNVALPAGFTLSTESMALLRVQALADPQKPIPDIRKVINTLNFRVLRIDRRPKVNARSFDDVYFLELGDIPGQDYPEHTWTKRLKQAVDRMKCISAEVSILGCW